MDRVGITDSGTGGQGRRRGADGPGDRRRRLLRHHLRAQPLDERVGRLLDVEREPALPLHGRADGRAGGGTRRTARRPAQPAHQAGAVALLVDGRLRTLLRAADVGGRGRRRMAGRLDLAAGDRRRHRHRRARRRPRAAAHPRRLGADRHRRRPGPAPARSGDGRRHGPPGGAAGRRRRRRLPPRQSPAPRCRRAGRFPAHPGDDARLAAAVDRTGRYRDGHPRAAHRRAVDAVSDRRAGLRRDGHDVLLPRHRPGTPPPRRPGRGRGDPGGRGAVHAARRGTGGGRRGAAAIGLGRTRAHRRRAVRACAGSDIRRCSRPAAGRRCRA